MDPEFLSRRVCIEKEGKMFGLSVFGRDLPSKVTQKLGLSKWKIEDLQDDKSQIPSGEFFVERKIFYKKYNQLRYVM